MYINSSTRKYYTNKTLKHYSESTLVEEKYITSRREYISPSTSTKTSILSKEVNKHRSGTSTGEYILVHQTLYITWCYFHMF